MRFIHTADWHLGRLFHGLHLTEDQAYVLDRFVDLVRDVRPDALIVAGDVYDRAVPPPEAVTLLDDVLCRLVLDLEVPVVMIAGNHDSPDRLGFGSRLLAPQRLHVFGSATAEPGRVTFRDEHGPVHVYALPYAEPPVVRQCLDEDGVRTHDDAMRAQLERVRAAHPAGERSIVVAHAFVAGCAESESERPLSVGGAGTVDAACFAGFDYVALGHLHRPQWVAGRSGDDRPNDSHGAAEAAEPEREGRSRARYSGSLLKYSFSEADQPKSVSIVEMDADGHCVVEEIGLEPRRDVRRIEGELAELLERGKDDPRRDDYIMARLLDRGALLDPMGKLRDVYPNVLHIERPFLTEGRSGSGGPRPDHRRMTDDELFADFVRDVTGEPLTTVQRKALTQVLESLQAAEREVDA